MKNQGINNFMEENKTILEKVSSFAHHTSMIVSKLAAYTVTNGLIYFFLVRVECKYPDKALRFAAPIVVLLFMIFLIDLCTNHLPFLKKEGEVKPSTKMIITGSILAGLTSWVYLSGIYQPLFFIPNEIWECKFLTN